MKGFTLVEMLAALFVFGLVSAAGALVMGSTLDGQTVVRSRMDQLAAFQRTRIFLKADLSQLSTRRTRDAAGVQAAGAFIGRQPSDGTAFMLLTRHGWENAGAAPRASMQRVDYRLAEGRLERVTRAALDGAPAGQPQILLEGVDQLQIAYLYRGAWTPTWTAAPNAELPQAVRIAFRVQGLGRFEQVLLTPGSLR
jgi:general secretion pathway protein J